MLSIFGFVILIVATIAVTRGASGNGRNPLVWGALTFVGGLIFQFVFPILAIIVLAVYYAVTGVPESEMENYLGWPAIWLSVGGLILSIVYVIFLVNRVSVIPEESYADTASVPPPPVFDGNEN